MLQSPDFICTSMNVPLFFFFLNFFLWEDLSPLLKGIQLRFFGTKQENSVSPLFQPSFPYSKALSMIISLVSTNPVRKTNGKVPVQCKLHHFSSLIALWRGRTCKRDSKNHMYYLLGKVIWHLFFKDVEKMCKKNLHTKI